MKRVITFFVLTFFSSGVFAQDCANTLKEAKDLFEQGLLEKVPVVMENCLTGAEGKGNSGFNKTQLLEAYKLLTITYLFDDEYEKADEVMLKLLKLEPEFEVNPAIDPIEFIQLFNSYRTLPVYTFGVHAGSNFTIVQRTARYGIEPLGTLENGQPNYSSYNGGLGFVGGIKANRYLSPKMDLSLDIMFRTNNFSYQSSQTLGFAATVSEETQNWIYMPLTLTYDFKKDRKDQFWPYLRFGVGTGLLFGAEASLTRTYEDGTIPEGAVQGKEVEVSKQRKPYTVWGTVGAGFKYKIKRGYLFMDLTYNHGVINVVNANQRYNNSELLYKYYYVDDNFLVHGFNLSVGLMRSVYKPKKLSHTVKVKKKKGKSENSGEEVSTDE